MHERFLTFILAAVLLFSVALTIYLIVSPAQGECFTEFYILGPGGKAYDYPTNITVGENGTVIIGVVNHEYKSTEYILKALLDNVTLLEKNLSLEHNESFQGELTFTPTEKGKGKLEFLLYRGSSTPYRSLHLWVDVV